MAVTVETLTHAIVEARRFIERAEVAQMRLRHWRYASCSYADTAAAKRASMDLTRALAELRRRA